MVGDEGVGPPAPRSQTERSGLTELITDNDSEGVPKKKKGRSKFQVRVSWNASWFFGTWNASLPMALSRRIELRSTDRQSAVLAVER